MRFSIDQFELKFLQKHWTRCNNDKGSLSIQRFEEIQCKICKAPQGFTTFPLTSFETLYNYSKLTFVHTIVDKISGDYHSTINSWKILYNGLEEIRDFEVNVNRIRDSELRFPQWSDEKNSNPQDTISDNIVVV